jgi:hypothetical protein
VPFASRTLVQLSFSASTSSEVPFFTCVTTSLSVLAAARTFSAEAMTRTVPMTLSV